jgi:hypothetical protein
MSINVRDGVIHLEGRCGVEEAETLLGHLSVPGVRIDLGGCEHLHAALFQLLMAARVPIAGEPAGFVAEWLLPILAAREDRTADTG